MTAETAAPAATSRGARRSVLIDNLVKRYNRGDSGIRSILVTASKMEDPDLDAKKLVYAYTGKSPMSQDAGMITACTWAVFHRSFTAPVNAPGVSLGAALRRLPSNEGERLIRALDLATERSLREHLVAAGMALGAGRSVPDWHRLHQDVYNMLRYDPRRVLRRWATDLYHQPHAATNEQPTDKPAENTTENTTEGIPA